MKKLIFLIAGAVLFLASCSNDEVIGVNKGRAIDFRTAVATRAAEITTGKITKIHVTAIDKTGANLFSNLEFSKESSSSFFVSNPSYYWPSDDSDLKFYAYSPSAEDLQGALNINNTTKSLANFIPAAVIADQKDFVSVNVTGKKSKNESTGVSLEFKHRLAQIEVKAKNTNGGYVFKVKGVRIGKPKSKGTFDFETGQWTLDMDKTDYDVNLSSEVTLTSEAQSLMGTDGNAMLLPQTLTPWNTDADKDNSSGGAFLGVLVNIKTKDGALVYPAMTEQYAYSAVAIGTKWEAGKKYIYTLDFSNGGGKVDPNSPNPGTDIFGKPIKFTVEVKEWTTDTQQAISM